MQHHALALKTMATLPHHVAHLLIKRIRKGDMTHEPTLEERERPHALRAIDNLVRNDKIPRLDLLGQTPSRRERNDAPDANLPQRGDVRAHGDFGRVVLVVDAVAREEGDRDGLAGCRGGMFQDGDGRGRRAPWCVDVEHGRQFEVFERVESRAADHGDVHGVF